MWGRLRKLPQPARIVHTATSTAPRWLTQRILGPRVSDLLTRYYPPSGDGQKIRVSTIACQHSAPSISQLRLPVLSRADR